MKTKLPLILLCLLAACSGTPLPRPTASLIPVAETPVPTPPDPSALGFSDSGLNVGSTRTFFGLEVVDIDLDGDLDIYFANYVGPDMLFLNDGSGGFTNSRQPFGSYETHGADIADLNGDGFPDIFAVNHHSPARVYFNDGHGGFTDSGQELALAATNPTTVVLGDADQDGDVDAFIVHTRQPNTLWLNDGAGVFTKSDTTFGGTFSVAMALVDLNDDGVLEMILCEHGRPATILIYDGAGNYIDSGITVGTADSEELLENDVIASGDIDGDGDIDLALGNNNTGVQIFLNENDGGSFTAAGPGFEQGVRRFHLIDADLDGDLDMVTTNMSNETRLWINAGDGSFSNTGTLFEGVEVLTIAVGKLDADADFDLVFGILELDGPNRLYFNQLISNSD